MTEMSKAIREQIEERSKDNTLRGLDDETLDEYVRIVGAFYMDLRDEATRRQEGRL
jgi:hypothetical protein